MPTSQLCSNTLSCSPIQVGRKTIIHKLFFDLAQDEENVLDAEFLKVPEFISFSWAPSPLSSLSAPLQGGHLEYGGGVLVATLVDTEAEDTW